VLILHFDLAVEIEVVILVVSEFQVQGTVEVES
jgi:hypothetical protein